MKSYRCVVRRSALGARPSTMLEVTAPDCRAAASAALAAVDAHESDWIEVWDEDELVFMRRRSNLHPLQAALQMAQAELTR
jgi:hypothetical protein